MTTAAARGELFDTYHQFYEANLRMRARASQLWVVSVDNCHPAGGSPFPSAGGSIMPRPEAAKPG